jgi:hypothetical protein
MASCLPIGEPDLLKLSTEVRAAFAPPPIFLLRRALQEIFWKRQMWELNNTNAQKESITQRKACTQTTRNTPASSVTEKR